MADTGQGIFELVPLVENINIKYWARLEYGVKQLLAVVTSDGDILLHYTYGEMNPILRHIPWFTYGAKTIKGICFDPTATWLLAVCIDCSLYIIPALNLVDNKQRIDAKWSLTDITHFPKHPQIPDSLPTSLLWWQTLDSNQNALVGFENGAIVLISLTDGRYLGSCSITEAVQDLFLCQAKDYGPDVVALLITGRGGQQWRLVLEHRTSSYVWPPDSNNQPDDSNRSRLYSLRQLGVSLKQRLSEARGGRRDSQTSDTASESSHSESVQSNHSGPEMLPHLCDTFFAPQRAKERNFLSAFYKPTSLLTVHSVDIDSAPLYVYKLPQNTAFVLLTDKVIYTINNDRNMISLLSTHLTECRLEGDSEFNNEAVLAQFCIENGTVEHIFKSSDLGPGNFRNIDSRLPIPKTYPLNYLPKSIDECLLERPRIDTCIVITNNAIYKVKVKLMPVLKFMQHILEENDYEAAERLSIIYELKMPTLLEKCGDILLAQESYHSGIIMYKQAKVHLLKRVLRLALVADCKTLLKFIHLCLNASKVDMSVATKIHIGNLAVMAYTELILRYSGFQRTANLKDFMNFLCCEEHYDQVLAVNVACQAGYWDIVTLLAKSRGLQLEAVTALGQILQSARAPRPSDKEFLYTLSEPSLTQSLLISSHSSQIIFQYIRMNLETFPLEILRRLAIQLDPSQPCALPLVSRIFSSTKHSSGLDTTIESVDLENPDKSIVGVKDFIDTFLCVVICLTAKTNKTGFDLDLLQTVSPPEVEGSDEVAIKKFPDLRILSCGFEHAAIIRNSDLYSMGAATSGCLGLGPLLSTSSPPKLVKSLSDLKVKVLSVSCGRRHTLTLTDFGVYAWGSNTYGQLGLGNYVVDSPYPQILSRFSAVKVVDVCAGQYHSLALTFSGKVYSWGWGIHGQLGHGDCNNELYPKLLKFSEPVKQIAAGHAHTLILTTEGKIYGFGSNIFGQLECRQMDTNKSAQPVWIVLQPDMYTPVEKIATSYFHNLAVTADQDVYVWGASPQELRIFQSKNNLQKNGIKTSDAWRNTVIIYSSSDKNPIEQVDVGYRHSVVLHNGEILWGRSRDEELCSPKLQQQDTVLAQRLIRVSCGWDYTMAIDHRGKLIAWGSLNMAQTLLGRPLSVAEERRLEGKMVVFKNTKRLVRFPNNNSTQGTSDSVPMEVPGLPSMAITFSSNDQKSLLTKSQCPYAIFKIENKEVSFEVNANSLDHIYDSPELKFGQKTLHFALETYYGFYDFENILAKCLEAQNFQAAAKIAMLNGHFGDSLGFQLRAFKRQLEYLNLGSIKEKDSYEKDVELIVKSIHDDLNEKNLTYSNNTQSPAHILSTSSSLDSIRQWGDDLEHQGGLESPCDLGDVRQNVTHYVQSLRNETENSPPISSVSKIIAESDICEKKQKLVDEELSTKDKHVIKAIEDASSIVEFYIRKIYISENHILMQNILMKCIEFWLANNLPVSVLEGILLKNLDKYFYPLSVLLFCKNFEDGSEDGLKRPTSGFLREFSTKFCLQLCSMVLDNVTKA